MLTVNSSDWHRVFAAKEDALQVHGRLFRTPEFLYHRLLPSGEASGKIYDPIELKVLAILSLDLVHWSTLIKS
jgi:hypothetical protein